MKPHPCNFPTELAVVSPEWVDPAARSLEVSVANCRVCTRTDTLRKGRCPACNKFLKENGYERPDKLIVKAADRHERKRHASSYDVFDANENTCMTAERHTDSPVWPSCSCGCSRLADGYKSHDGLSKHCRDLAWYKSQQTAEVA